MLDPLRPRAIVYRAEEDEVSLCAQANEELAQAIQHEGQAREHYLAFGRLLLRLQEERRAAGHSHDWEKFLKENIRCSLRTAYRWMAVVKDSSGSNSASVAELDPERSEIPGAEGADARHEQNGQAPRSTPADEEAEEENEPQEEVPVLDFPLDEAGQVVPYQARSAFEGVEEVLAVCKAMDAIVKALAGLEDKPVAFYAKGVRIKSFMADLKRIRKTLWNTRPQFVEVMNRFAL